MKRLYTSFFFFYLLHSLSLKIYDSLKSLIKSQKFPSFRQNQAIRAKEGKNSPPPSPNWARRPHRSPPRPSASRGACTSWPQATLETKTKSPRTTSYPRIKHKEEHLEVRWGALSCLHDLVEAVPNAGGEGEGDNGDEVGDADAGRDDLDARPPLDRCWMVSSLSSWSRSLQAGGLSYYGALRRGLLPLGGGDTGGVPPHASNWTLPNRGPMIGHASFYKFKIDPIILAHQLPENKQKNGIRLPPPHMLALRRGLLRNRFSWMF